MPYHQGKHYSTHKIAHKRPLVHRYVGYHKGIAKLIANHAKIGPRATNAHLPRPTKAFEEEEVFPLPP